MNNSFQQNSRYNLNPHFNYNSSLYYKTKNYNKSQNMQNYKIDKTYSPHLPQNYTTPTLPQNSNHQDKSPTNTQNSNHDNSRNTQNLNHGNSSNTQNLNHGTSPNAQNIDIGINNIHTSTNLPIFEFNGIKLYNDDLLILLLIYFLYKEKVNDNLLYIALFALLFL